MLILYISNESSQHGRKRNYGIPVVEWLPVPVLAAHDLKWLLQTSRARMQTVWA
ncbi:MAG: hypothetical protein QOJ15_62 [Bradyrhizobium sp.]|jgi:hypothetical protein|nr:hypothetical protein [Bradyrhizobium sp.]